MLLTNRNHGNLVPFSGPSRNCYIVSKDVITIPTVQIRAQSEVGRERYDRNNFVVAILGAVREAVHYSE
ncbi:hypothetical protein LINGRAPRIM_LOCUS2237, partial [Linum grandiflorum]